MKREEAIRLLTNMKGYTHITLYEWLDVEKEAIDMAIEALSAEAVQEWIPIKYHGITESEREENGYPKDWVYFLDCEMPQDGQEILVQAKNGEIRWDVCYEDDGFSLDSGWDWTDDIIAWMPLPEPYKGGDEE